MAYVNTTRVTEFGHTTQIAVVESLEEIIEEVNESKKENRLAELTVEESQSTERHQKAFEPQNIISVAPDSRFKDSGEEDREGGR